MTTRSVILFACIMLCSYGIFAQSDSTLNKPSSVNDINSKVLNGLQNQYTSLQSKLDKQSVKLLSKMQKREDKLHTKLNSIDSNKAKQLFTDDIKQHYIDLQSTLSNKTDKLKKFPLKEYMPGLDSMQTSLSFLMNNPNLPTDKLAQLQSVTAKLKDLQGQLQKANDIQTFIREREATLKEQLMNTGLGKQLTGINKQVYYYQAQLAEYKSLLNDKEKLKEKLLETVRALPLFQKFWQKNSYLAALFPMPSGSGTTQSITVAGLQTRASVQNLIAQRVGTAGGTGANPQQYFQQQVDAAQAQLNQLKDKLNKFSDGGGSDMTMPDFKPNNQKTKSFLQRLEYGFNIQSQPGEYYLPATSSIAATVGYKLSDNKRFGIGASYIMGWGNGIKDIHLSSEGVGLRSYVDIKSPFNSKGKFFNSLWLSGGFEYNYLSSFRSLQDLHNNVDIWQRSVLMGMSKKYKVGKKEGNMQLLYDFLHNEQIPVSTAFKFRIGYTF
jgi:hypothetical protein